MTEYRSVETEGDGLKSYLATCIALLLGRRPICLIDEPEMCLHPPQAYNLGRFIGRFGTSESTATFVATHSSHVLRGVIQTSDKLKIVRLTRRDESFEAHLVESTALAEALSKPTVRAESVLDGIFSQAVVVVEADTDRTVYQATWETLQNEMHLDIHFAAVGGTGGIADTCHLYRTLQIPIAVVADPDLLLDVDSLGRILKRMTGEPVAGDLITQAREVGNRIKLIPPNVSPEQVRAKLSAVLSSKMEWATDDDSEVRRHLSELAQDLDRMRRLKRDGVTALPADIQPIADQLLGRLRDIGLFLVPVGEVEEWLSGRGIQASKERKWAWANEAAACIRRMQAQAGDVWDFIRGVGAFLLA